jgi:PAS domain S-box-containing protein
MMRIIGPESLLNQLFKSPKGVFLITDEAYNIRYASDTVESVFGVKPISILGRNTFDFVPAEKRAYWKQCLDDANHNTAGEINLINAAGDELHFDVTVTNHINSHGIRGLVVYMHNITERIQMLERLTSHNDQLDHLIYKTTHDLRAPLRSAMGLISLAEREPVEYVKYLGLIKSSLQTLESLIEEVNSFYKNEKLAVQSEWIDLRALIQREIGNLSDAPEAEGIKIETFVGGDVPFYSDPIRVRTVVTNILSNSIKYHDPAKYMKYITVSATVFPDKVFITIEDNGIGIEEEYHEKIFDIFFRANNQSRGSGLGLYIVKDTLNRLGGTIYLKSTPGVGSSFTITIPNKPKVAALN